MLTAQRDFVVESSLLARISDARKRSDALFDIVREGSMYDRPIPERHRIIFYVGHLEAFDWNLLHENVFGLKRFHPQFDRLFAFGIDPVGGGLPNDQPADWPSLDSVRKYVGQIRAALDDKLMSVGEESVYMRDGFSLNTLLNVAIEHRLMHVETLAYMLHQLPTDRKMRPRSGPPPVAVPVHPSMIQIPAGETTLGLRRNGEAFGWDNEFEARALHVPPFEIDHYMITNGQFLEFLDDGGYRTRVLWSDADWQWRTEHSITHPVFWRRAEDAWLYRTMFEEIALPVDWPVYVSQAEASAYARWAGKGLPTEEQWHRAAYGSSGGCQRFYPWGDDAPNGTLGNFDFDSWDPVSVSAHPRGKSAFGVEGLLGNGWEWTSTAFAPYWGFEPFPFYPGYSADFFDGKHFVMKGGSPRTATCLLRPTFRNWFQSHYQYVYAGFRCIKA